MSHAIPPRKSNGSVSASCRTSHMAPPSPPHDAVACVNRPMNTCSLRQSGTLAPTSIISDSTATFTDVMGGTLDQWRNRTNPPDRLLSPCTRHSQVQAFISPDPCPSPSVLHHPIMSQRSPVPPYVYPAQAPNYQSYAYPAPNYQSYVYPTPAPNYQSYVYPAPAPNFQSVQAPTSNTSSPPTAS